MESLTLELEIVTPLVLSGANQIKAELRPNSIKDIMRWWYRAGKGDTEDFSPNSNEFELFGSTEGASKFLPRIKRNGSKAEISINPIGTNKFDPESPTAFPSGLKYLAFPFRPQRENDFEPHRSQIEPNSYFPFSLIFLGRTSLAEKNSIMASLWLLLFLGGVGSRSRRGFGSLKVKNDFIYPVSESQFLQFSFNEEFDDFPKFLRNNLQIALTAIESSRPTQVTKETNFTTLLSSGSKFYFWRTSFQNWETALDKAGSLLQKFRSFKKPRNYDDYDSISDFLIDRKNKPFQYKRAAFGLPININYRSLGNKKAIVEGGFENNDNEDADHNRRSSPLFIKVLKVNEKQFALLFLYLPAKLLPDGESLKIKAKNGHRSKDYCVPPDFSLIDDFFKSINNLDAEGNKNLIEISF